MHVSHPPTSPTWQSSNCAQDLRIPSYTELTTSQRFRTCHTPIKGLTSDVYVPHAQICLALQDSPTNVLSLIHASTIAYGTEPSYGRFASHQPEFSTAIANVVLELPGVIETTTSRAESLAAESGEKRVLEWGGTEPGVRTVSGETYTLA